MLLSEDPCKHQVSLERLKTILVTVGMRCAFSKCEILLLNWIGSKMNLVHATQKLGKVGRFSYLASCI